MRKQFADELYSWMKTNKDIYLLVGDLGYKVWDDHFRDFPDRCINCGASEQAMLDIAVGLSLSGKKVFVYSITPFLIYRPFETIRTYLAKEKIPIILVGSGRDNDYEHDGYSHDATDVRAILGALGGITLSFPETSMAIPRIVETAVNKSDGPMFISLSR